MPKITAIPMLLLLYLLFTDSSQLSYRCAHVDETICCVIACLWCCWNLISWIAGLSCRSDKARTRVSNQHTGMKRAKAAAKAVSKAPSDMLYALESALNSIGKSLDDFSVSRTEKLVVDTAHPPPLDALDHLKRLFVCTDKEGSQFMPQRSCERRWVYKFCGFATHTC
jgi:hypothetical protein